MTLVRDINSINHQALKVWSASSDTKFKRVVVGGVKGRVRATNALGGEGFGIYRLVLVGQIAEKRTRSKFKTDRRFITNDNSEVC